MFRSVLWPMRTRLLLSFLLVLSIVLIAGILGLMQLEGELRSQIVARSNSLVRSVLDQLENDVYSRVEQARELAASAEIASVLEQSNQRFAALGTPREIEDYLDRQDRLWRT